MNARHEAADLFDAADEIPGEAEQREFFEWAQIVSARSTLERAVQQGDSDAIRAVRELGALLDAQPPRAAPVFPSRNRLADGPPPF